MSRWGAQLPRAEISAVARERAQLVRSRRRGPRGTRLFGLLLIATAIAFALDPEYPLPRTEAASTSSSPRVYLLPEPIEPIGQVAAVPERFTWRWTGPAVSWQFVLLDEGMQEIGRDPVRVPMHHTPSAGLQGQLVPGARVHWYAEGNLEGRRFRTPPIAVEISR